MKLRKVSVKGYPRTEPEEGIFHAWGIEAYQENCSGDIGWVWLQASMAIVEFPDGHVEMIHPDYVTFKEAPDDTDD